MMKRILAVLALALVVAACGDDVTSPDDLAVFEVVVSNESFYIGLSDSARIAEADALLASGAETIVHGTLARGDGGFNDGYSWHVPPGTVTFVEVAIEACSGRPLSDVEADVDYWVDTMGIYCPWGSEIVRRVR